MNPIGAASLLRIQRANFGCPNPCVVSSHHLHETGKLVLEGIVSQNQLTAVRKTNNLTKRGIMSASYISTGRLTALDTVPCPVLRGLSVKGITNGCLCLGDFFLHDNALRNGAVRAAVSFHSARSVSLNIPPSPIGPSVPHMRSNSDFWAAGQAVSRLRLQGFPKRRAVFAVTIMQ